MGTGQRHDGRSQRETHILTEQADVFGCVGEGQDTGKTDILGSIEFILHPPCIQDEHSGSRIPRQRPLSPPIIVTVSHEADARPSVREDVSNPARAFLILCFHVRLLTPGLEWDTLANSVRKMGLKPGNL
ncbi:hypothetical protein DPEC_G00223540 [Dallia pectoralis]|uniref:Uncharacterized protein n=1 Tax=Dallia pectoralis TaxID=75939 RepID=A0ACC2FZM6_DALPE|nr:hypothetical protein DPEC_G00223540 [Dallia pectoralis]